MNCYALWTAITQRGCLFLQRDTHVSSKYVTQTHYGYGGIYGDVGFPILRVPICLTTALLVYQIELQPFLRCAARDLDLFVVIQMLPSVFYYSLNIRTLIAAA